MDREHERFFALQVLENGWKLKVDLGTGLEKQGWQVWLKTLAPQSFNAPFSEVHIEFWDRFWELLRKKKSGEIISENDRDIVLPFGRGMGKSTNVEMAAIAEGCVLGSGFCLYLCDSQLLAEEHLFSVKSILESPAFAKYYPAMGKPKLQNTGTQAKFTQDTIICENGWAMTARGITSNVRGGRVGASRFTLVVNDDIDSLTDSLMVIEKKKRILTRTVFPAMSKDGVTLLAQNLITENSIASQVINGKTDVLSNRTVIGGGPVKAFKELNLQPFYDDLGHMRWRIDSCVPTWEYFNIEDARSFLARSGKEAFLAEYQHEFDERSGRVISNYNEERQVITWDQFEKVAGERKIPAHWNAACGLDVGFSDGMHPHYSAWDFIAIGAMNSPLAGKHFVYRSRTFKGLSADDQAIAINQELSVSEKAQITRWQISHEATGVMLTLRRYGMPFTKNQHYKATDGVAQWNHLSLANKAKPNPFKEDVQAADGTWLLGDSNIYYIVENDRELEKPTDDRGMRVLREQVSGWNWVITEITKTGLTEEKPSKINDDHNDVVKGLLQWFQVAEAKPLTFHEELQKKVASHTVYARELVEDTSISAQISRSMAVAKSLKELKDEDGWEVDEQGVESERDFFVPMSDGW